MGPCVGFRAAGGGAGGGVCAVGERVGGDGGREGQAPAALTQFAP